MDAKTLAIPTVHLNGTSKDALTQAYADAIDAIHDAGRKLAAAYPNARDYYVQGPDAASRAMDQHQARMKKLKEVADELDAILMAID